MVVVGKSIDEHLFNLPQVLERLRQAGLKLQPGKCKFLSYIPGTCCISKKGTP